MLCIGVENLAYHGHTRNTWLELESCISEGRGYMSNVVHMKVDSTPKEKRSTALSPRRPSPPHVLVT